MGDGIAVSLLAIVLTFGLPALVSRPGVIAHTGSVAIKTDNIHYKSDLFLNLTVVVALVLEQALQSCPEAPTR